MDCELILHDYDCTEITIDDPFRPSLFTENEWNYLLSQLHVNNLLDVPLNIF